MSFTGRLLVATPLILDPNFYHSVVYVYAYQESEGAAGVIVNRATDEPTTEHLPQWRSVLAAPPTVFWGGPVAPDNGLVLVSDGEAVTPADDLDPPPGGVKARLFVGQSGWGPGQLEAEMDEGAWLVMDPEPSDVFPAFPDILWPNLLRRIGGRAALWATHLADPTVN
ncbi:MAG: YqgE/AlgH family protein [Acidimicrobiia bacterium]